MDELNKELDKAEKTPNRLGYKYEEITKDITQRDKEMENTKEKLKKHRKITANIYLIGSPEGKNKENEKQYLIR